MKYLCLIRKAFKLRMTYRGMVVSELFFTALNHAIQFSLWYALMGSGFYQGVSFKDMMVYSIVSGLITTAVNVDVASTLEAQIRDGSVVTHLIRPVSLKGQLIADALGGNAYKLLVVQLPLVLLIYLIFDFTLPPTAAHGFLFLLSVALGMLLMIEIQYLVGLAAFVLQRTWYLDWYIEAGLSLFGGAQIPLWFFPSFLYGASRALPFRYIVYEPMNLYLGRTAVADAFAPLALACAWIAGLILLERLVWARLERRLTVNGG